MGSHIVDGQFKSDKYPWCPAGFVALKLTDRAAQPVLWDYAQRHRSVDDEFSADLEMALRAKGYEPPSMTDHEPQAREMAQFIERFVRHHGHWVPRSQRCDAVSPGGPMHPPGPCSCNRHRAATLALEKLLLAARDAAVRETREADVAALTQLAAERRATRKPTMDAGTQNRIVTYCGALGDGVNTLRALMPAAAEPEEAPM